MPLETRVERASISMDALLEYPKFDFSTIVSPTTDAVTPVTLALRTFTQLSREFVAETVGYDPSVIKSEFDIVYVIDGVPSTETMRVSPSAILADHPD
jgi:hypothetical protein